MRDTIPGGLSTQQRDGLEFVIWHTQDDFGSFDLDDATAKLVLEHKFLAHAGGAHHWFMPDHPTLSRVAFSTEYAAFVMQHTIEA